MESLFLLLLITLIGASCNGGAAAMQSYSPSRIFDDYFDDGSKCFPFGLQKCMIPVNMLHHPIGMVSLVSLPVSRYVIRKQLGAGGFGEAWLSLFLNCTQVDHLVDFANKKEISRKQFCVDPQNLHSQSYRGCYSSSEDGDYFVIKRIMAEKGQAFYQSGLREKHFGEVLSNASLHYREWNKHIARYVESVDCGEQGIWLIFRYEGISLSNLLYATGVNDPSTGSLNSVRMLQQSLYWKWLKTTKAGEEEMKQIILHLLMALKFCHDHGITHRDIKPDNMIMCHANDGCLKQKSGDNQQVNIRIIDFGSAIDEFSLKHLYGPRGPSSYEQTFFYTPPEAFLNSSWFLEPESRLKYDMWTVGVVILEMIFGSPHVFRLSHRAYAFLALQYKNMDEEQMKLLYQIRALMELCIEIPEDVDLLRNLKVDNLGNFLTSRKCSEEVFSNHIKSRDPLKIGFPNTWSLQLVRQLLRWKPEERLSASEALRHPFFQLRQ